MIPLIVAPDLRQACPSLAHFPGDAPAVLPHTVLGDTNGGWSTAYLCPCGERWSLSWSAESPWPEPELSLRRAS